MKDREFDSEAEARSHLSRQDVERRTAEPDAAAPNRAGESLLRLQRLYGNRYVQRVVAQAKQDEGGAEVSPGVEEAIERARGGGQPLDSGVRAQMEPAFDANFSGVRVHIGTQADALNRSLNARAFTTGQDIFFRQGAYNPGSSSGRELLAHELTHAVQQNGDTVQLRLTVGQTGDKYEQEAEQVAKTVVQRTPRSSSAEPWLVQKPQNGVFQQTPLRIQRTKGTETPETPAEVTTLDVQRAIETRLLYVAIHVEQAVDSFGSWVRESAPGVGDLDAFSKYLKGKATAVFGFFLAGPYAVGATLVYEVITTAVDSALAAKIKSLEDFTEKMTGKCKEKMIDAITKKNNEATDAELRKAVGSVDQSKVNVANKSEMLDALVTTYFKVPDYPKIRLWPQIMEKLVEQYLTFYWDKVVPAWMAGIMMLGKPRSFSEEMKYQARAVIKGYEIDPMPSSDGRFVYVKSLLEASNLDGLFKYTRSLRREDRIAIGRNPDTKKLIDDSDFTHIQKAMAYGDFLISP